MTIRKLLCVVPVIAVLAVSAPLTSAQAVPGPAGIPCYPYPAFCGPNGQPWFKFLFPFTFPFHGPFNGPHFGPGPVQLSPVAAPHFGPGPVQIPRGS